METKDNLWVTLAQVDLTWEDPQKNRLDLEILIRQLKGKSDLIILPETFTTGFSMHANDLAEPMDGSTITWMRNVSNTTGLAICGSLLIKERELCYNRCVFIKPDGAISFYDKRHLFSIGGESSKIVPGDKRLIVSFMGWRIALYTCYDIRFPVWCRNRNDTDLMIFTANWPASRQEVWKILLKARAIENQVYVAGVNRIGTDGNGILYAGESQMVSSKGEVMTETGETRNGLFTYEISKKELFDFRIKFPVSNDADKFLII